MFVDYCQVAVPHPKLSLAMIVKNESRCLARCLQSVKGIVDEMVVADTGSTDDTTKIAREFGAKISNFDWVDDFAAARNFAIAQTAGDWILVLDADEWAGEDLAGEIPAFVRGKPAVGRLKIVSDFRRHNQTFRSQCFVSRLFPRGAHFKGHIHEQLISPLPRAHLRGELWHDGYLETPKAGRNMKLVLIHTFPVPICRFHADVDRTLVKHVAANPHRPFAFFLLYPLNNSNC